MDDTECTDIDSPDTCEYLDEQFNLCSPNSLMFSSMVSNCALTCKQCEADEPDNSTDDNSTDDNSTDDNSTDDNSGDRQNDDAECVDYLASETAPDATLNCQTFKHLCTDPSAIGQRVFTECPVTCGSCRQDDDPVCEDVLANAKSPDPTLNCQTFKKYCTADGNIAERVRAECRLTCGFCTPDQI